MTHTHLNFVAMTLVAAVLAAACTSPTPAPATSAPATSAPATEAAPTEAPPTIAPTEPAAETAPTETGAVAVNGVRTYSFDPSQSQASYSVDEFFLQESNRLATAVGVTSVISGDLQINFDDPAASPLGTVTIDISVLESDSNMRDNAIRRQWLESSTYPLAMFTATAIEGLSAAPAPDETVSFNLTGDMTVHDTTLPVTWEVTATLDGENLVGTATTQILMADFGVVPPSNPFISVTDGVTLTFNYVLLPTN